MASLAPVFASGTSAQDFIGWMAVGIVIAFIIGMLLYFFFVHGARERDRRMVQARARAARGTYPAQRGAAAERYPLTRGYDEAPQDMPDAVRAAYDDIRSGRGGQYRQYAGPDDAYAGETDVTQDRYEPLPAGRPARRAPGAAKRQSPPAGSVRSPDVLDELLGSRRQNGEPVRLEAEDRQLLWEESHEAEVPTAAPEEEEVLFIDDETEGAIPEEGSAEPGGPPAKDEFVTGPLALILLQKDIENAVREGPRGPGPRNGPAWSEGRPVFSKPLEAPTEAAHASAAQPPPLDMDEFTVQLKSLAEKKKIESRRLTDDRMRREQQNARDDAARQQAQQKRDEKLRREIRGRVRAGISEAQKQQAAEGPPGMSAAEEEALKAQDEKKLEEQRRKEERRKRWLELQKKHEVETIEDVLSKIGIK